MSKRGDPQASALARIIRQTDPDVLLLNEIDWDSEGQAVRGFLEHYLAHPRGGLPGTRLRHWFAGPVNTGAPSGADLDRDGRLGEPEDAVGFGRYPGQYGMALLSAHPIDEAAIRTFTHLPWARMPDARLPDRADTPAPADWYPLEVRDSLRLSSKAHWDVPVRLPDGSVLHLLASHPTPPAFDGPEDRNGRRNADEIRLWRDYLTPGAGDYLIDQRGHAGGLPESARFVLLGDLNLDPMDGTGHPDAIRALLSHPRIQDPQPRSTGASLANLRDGDHNTGHRGDPALDTADFNDDPGPGNLRVDYVLPDRHFTVLGAGVAWPEAAPSRPRFPSDHHLVWVDLRL